MMKKIGAALFALIFFAMLSPAGAQFADQATAIQSVAGTNTITGQLPNMSGYPDVLNVLVKLTPANGNVAGSPTTLNLNSLGAITIYKPTLGGIVPLTGTELVAGQPAVLMYNGTVFVLLSVASTTVGASNLANSALSAMSLPVNMQINAAVSANQLTVSLCAINSGSNTCNNPSATSPLLISFRDTTAANGDPVILSQQAALNFTALSTSSFGCLTATTCRLWVIGINNGGTLALCLFNALQGTTVAPINEAANQTSQTGTTGGASAQLYYCSASAVTGKAIRILGYVEATWVSGTGWSTTPSLVQIFGPGIKKPGDTVQRLFSTNITQTSTTTSYAAATNFNQAITPTSAANLIYAHAEANYQTTANDGSNAQLSRGTGCSTLIGNNAVLSGSTSVIGMAPVTGFDSPNTASPVTYALCIKSGVNGATSINGNAGNISSMTLEEIMSAIEPANDDLPIRMVG